MSGETLQPPARELEAIEAFDHALMFPSFTSQTAWELGTALRSKLLAVAPAKPAVVDISLAQGGHCLFHCVTNSGTAPDNDRWVTRKRNTVLRFSRSTWYMHNKFKGDETTFAAKYGLGPQGAVDYAIHGGGWPVRVRGVEGVVAVVVVSGLTQDMDHAVIVNTVGELLESMGVEVGDKKKED
ncbi:hypothetical protein K470DRAFT_77341 [Piedraia hortae CBS 480.64]|uniref:DUF967 domain protein n=1 Tax=Piedraia hortae CBS 480.64 TaxID=1314780 RepID=A0A6A7BYC7_9PEZI|nr:hypothetical protein K470DRAFT_77341 [Piedraia hortae CBS 480.64]